jgi:hypothetical protein
VRLVFARGAFYERSTLFYRLQVGSRSLPVTHGALRQLERLSLLGALARTALATRPGEDEKANAAKYEDTGAEGEQHSFAAVRGRCGGENESTRCTGRRGQQRVRNETDAQCRDRHETTTLAANPDLPSRDHQCSSAQSPLPDGKNDTS